MKEKEKKPLDILVLDDSDAMQTLLIEVLTAEGNDNISVTSDPDIAINTDADLYLLDYNLKQKLNGDDVANALRKRKGYDICLVCTSSLGPRDSKLYDGHLVKPFDLRTLSIIVEAVRYQKYHGHITLNGGY